MKYDASSSSSTLGTAVHHMRLDMVPYTSEASKASGSRQRIINAAFVCCRDQDLLTIQNSEEAWFPVSGLRWYQDNDVLFADATQFVPAQL